MAGLNLFGFQLVRKQKEDSLPSFIPKHDNDGAVTTAVGGYYGSYLDIDGSVRTEAELITKYRTMAQQPEIDAAIEEIVNESMSIDEDVIVKIDLSNVKNISDKIKNVITDEFHTVLKLLEFQKVAFEIYRRWYIDGRLYYNVIIDPKNVSEGIKELRYIDPRKLRKVREFGEKKIEGGSSVEGSSNDTNTVNRLQNEYYIFNPSGFNTAKDNIQALSSQASILRIAKDSIIHSTSGLHDVTGTLVLSYLHKAIKPINELRTMEDSLVIYRIARAPERRVWYIDVGNLPKMKADQLMQDTIALHRNKVVYDASTGEIRDERRYQTMLDDYWLARREGGKGTQVETLKAGENLSNIEDIIYFQKKLLKSLNVPIGRLDADTMFTLGRATEVSRDEVKFFKFVSRLRSRFANIFTDTLEKQVVLKGIMTIEEWQDISHDVKYDFTQDNHFTELKDQEIMNSRIEAMRNAQDMIGKYISQESARQMFLRQTKEDMEEEDKRIEEEAKDPKWQAFDQLNALANGEDDGGEQQGGDEAPPPEEDTGEEKKVQPNKLQQAKLIYDRIKKIPHEQRTDKQKHDFKVATEIVAKNS